LADAEQARDWYERRELGLGSDFLDALEGTILEIAESTEFYRFIRKPYRRSLMRRFPFLVVFEERDKCVWILAVFHTSRNPGELDLRLAEE
jgi:plasmid stabilization system protein ParE